MGGCWRLSSGCYSWCCQLSARWLAHVSVHQRIWSEAVPGWNEPYVLTFPPISIPNVYIDFKPSSVIFSAHHFGQIVVSDVGVILWALAVGFSISRFGFGTVFRVYLAPYLWWVYLSLISETSLISPKGKPLAYPHHIPSAHRPSPSPLPCIRVHLPSWCSVDP